MHDLGAVLASLFLVAVSLEAGAIPLDRGSAAAAPRAAPWRWTIPDSAQASALLAVAAKLP